jgi:uncharacterized membrane protein YeaQ/YmgE (transglycosylase-associated protein family)
MFAEFALHPGGIIGWLVVGLIAGWVAGSCMRGGGYGVIGDIVIGLIGAFVGGLIFSLFVEGDSGFWGSFPVALVGACFLVAILHAVAPRRRV